MRIMFAVGSYWPSQDGVANITEYLAEGLASRGHEVLVLTSAGDGGRQILEPEEEHAGVAIERMRIYVEWPLKLAGRDDESTPKRYMDRIRSYKPDVLIVVCAQTWPLDWLLPHLDEFDCAKVFYSHGFSGMKERYQIVEELKRRNVMGALREYKAQNYYKNLYKYLSKFDLIVQLSQINNSKTYCDEHGIESFVLENAVQSRFLDADMQHMSESKLTTTENNKNDDKSISFLYVANYNPNKNQEMLLRAFYKADIPGSHLAFTGFEENDYLKKLRALCDELEREGSAKNVGKTDIDFNIHLTREQIYELYKVSDVFISTSLSENSPIVHREAAACGMPVISLDVGDVRTLEGIILVSDTDELAVKMKELADNPEQMNEHGMKLHDYMTSMGCTIDDKVNQLEEELKKII